MDKRLPIDLALSTSTDASGNGTLRTQAFAPGGLLCIQRVAVRCTANSSINANVSFERAGSRLYLETLSTTVAGQIKALQGPVFAPSDYGICIELTSADANCLIEAWIYGYWIPPVE